VSETGVCKVADFGTSRFLEIAAHGTTVIGSPPYMAPEQFHGKAVFASDLYSLGVTMYQMLTGELPYEAPAPGDLDKLTSGELVTPLRVRRPGIPKRLADIVATTMAPDLTQRYQRAADLLADLLTLQAPARTPPAARAEPATATGSRVALDPPPPDLASRLRPRETPAPRFCWQCRKPLHARTDRCPFCGEAQ
jgi:serine/threonine protein kinase